LTVDRGFERDSDFFLGLLDIELEDGEGALLSFEVTGFAEGGFSTCVEDPRTNSYIVENIGMDGVCEISTEGECMLYETLSTSPLSDFDSYCGYENAWDTEFYYETSYYVAVTPCWIVLLVDGACGLLFLAAFIAVYIFSIRDSYFKADNPTHGTDIFVSLNACGKVLLFAVASLSLSLVGFSLYAVVTAGDGNEFTRTYRVTTLEEDALFNTVVVSFETETRWVRQRFVDACVRVATWKMLGVLYCICLCSERPVFNGGTLEACFYLVILANGLCRVRRDHLERVEAESRTCDPHGR
jgi:hypothetical protein